MALSGRTPIGKNCACAITQNPVKKLLCAREGGWQIAAGELQRNRASWRQSVTA